MEIDTFIAIHQQFFILTKSQRRKCDTEFRIHCSGPQQHHGSAFCTFSSLLYPESLRVSVQVIVSSLEVEEVDEEAGGGQKDLGAQVGVVREVDPEPGRARQKTAGQNKVMKTVQKKPLACNARYTGTVSAHFWRFFCWAQGN